MNVDFCLRNSESLKIILTEFCTAKLSLKDVHGSYPSIGTDLRSKTRSRRTVNRTFSVMKATRSPAGWALRAVRWNENAVFPRPLFERGWFRRSDGVLCCNCFEDLALNCLSLIRRRVLGNVCLLRAISFSQLTFFLLVFVFVVVISTLAKHKLST